MSYVTVKTRISTHTQNHTHTHMWNTYMYTDVYHTHAHTSSVDTHTDYITIQSSLFCLYINRNRNQRRSVSQHVESKNLQKFFGKLESYIS